MKQEPGIEDGFVLMGLFSQMKTFFGVYSTKRVSGYIHSSEVGIR